MVLNLVIMDLNKDNIIFYKPKFMAYENYDCKKDFLKLQKRNLKNVTLKFTTLFLDSH